MRPSANERRMVARFQAGEPEALGTLFELHVDRVFAYARHMLGNREDAEEVTSEAFVHAFERAASFRGDCPFRGWLFGITRNLCLDRLRQPRLLLLEPEMMEQQHDGGTGVRQLETEILVRGALAGLSREHQLVLLLCDVEEWDAREVAQALDKSVAATKSLLYRARRELRAKMTEIMDDDGTAEEKIDAM
jgi:RNA polymerase sigma-70 factor (ECF subfamily)